MILNKSTLEYAVPSLYQPTVKHILSNRIEYRNHEGLLHNIGRPAIEYPNGRKEWYVNGQLHRLDGPAVIFADETEQWYYRGELHRENGPAVVHFTGRLTWFNHGQIHRLDGPAVEWKDSKSTSYDRYFVDNVEYHTYLEYLVAVEQFNSLLL